MADLRLPCRRTTPIQGDRNNDVLCICTHSIEARQSKLTVEAVQVNAVRQCQLSMTGLISIIYESAVALREVCEEHVRSKTENARTKGDRCETVVGW